jgi:hypothetical protein
MKSKNFKPIEISFGGDSKVKTTAQNAMISNANPYEHLQEGIKKGEQKNYTIMFRGADNLAPQKDILLGLRSITHKRIAQQMARLVAGKGIEFYIKSPENEDGTLTESEELQLLYAEDFNKKGLEEARQTIANGLVYQNLASVVTTNAAPTFVEGFAAVTPQLVYMVAYPSERLRYSAYTMDAFGREIIEYHYYHSTWNFDPNREIQKPRLPKIIPIETYIELSQSGKVKDEAFAVHSSQSSDAQIRQYVSFEFALGNGIFDNAYPLPEWKANSSINDIQAEFESSCIRIDYLRNGLHIFAVVNVYSATFNTTSDNDFDTADEKWAEDLDIVKGLKGSYNSGRIIVNPVGTDDPNLDGTIKVEKIELSFPVEQVEFFNQEARSSILTAWGVMADLFSISKPEKNNLRSQGEFLKIGIMLLQQQIGIYQEAFTNGLNAMLKFYGLSSVASKIKPVKNSVFVAIMADVASGLMLKNELRDLIFDMSALDEVQLDQLLAEQAGKQPEQAPFSPTQNQP